MNKHVILIENITKQYYLEKPRTLKKWFSHLFSPFDKFTVIKNFSLRVNKGEFVLITGPNGSGKTTLLKLIARITEPDSGTIKTFGRIVPLIELGAGFNYELTGRENIIINATILGIDKKRMKEITSKVVNFSGLKNFIDIPLKRYSTGMVSRLAFAIASHSSPDILLLDEVFAVGDKKYLKKSLTKLKYFLKNGVTIILSSHFSDYLNLNYPHREVKLKYNTTTASGQLQLRNYPVQ
jgi:ABC-type polysaccharide/polyol phosphate transport system ATPase subunit